MMLQGLSIKSWQTLWYVSSCVWDCQELGLEGLEAVSFEFQDRSVWVSGFRFEAFGALRIYGFWESFEDEA